MKVQLSAYKQFSSDHEISMVDYIKYLRSYNGSIAKVVGTRIALV